MPMIDWERAERFATLAFTAPPIVFMYFGLLVCLLSTAITALCGR
jgi:hypothetical protein